MLCDDARDTLDVEIDRALRSRSHLRQRQIHFRRQQRQVLLCGRVESFFEKQLAQEAVRSIPGVDSIENELQVDWSAAEELSPAAR